MGPSGLIEADDNNYLLYPVFNKEANYYIFKFSCFSIRGDADWYSVNAISRSKHSKIHFVYGFVLMRICLAFANDPVRYYFIYKPDVLFSPPSSDPDLELTLSLDNHFVSC